MICPWGEEIHSRTTRSISDLSMGEEQHSGTIRSISDLSMGRGDT